MGGIQMTDVKGKLVKAVTGGRAIVGSNNVVDELLIGDIEQVVLSSNCPKFEKESISYYCKLSNIPVEVLLETSLELGSICGKPYPISAAAVK